MYNVIWTCIYKRQLLIKSTFSCFRQWRLQKCPHDGFDQTIRFTKRGPGRAIRERRDITCECLIWSNGIWCISFSITCDPLFSPDPEGHLSYCLHSASVVVVVSSTYLIISEMLNQSMQEWCLWVLEVLVVNCWNFKENTITNDLLVSTNNTEFSNSYGSVKRNGLYGQFFFLKFLWKL